VFFNDDTRQENCVSATADDYVRKEEKLMTSEASVPPTPVKGTDLAERLAQHLVGRPQDLIDARRLMRCFHISVADFQRALMLWEQHAPAEEAGERSSSEEERI
jgi:hypothetical protein